MLEEESVGEYYAQTVWLVSTEAMIRTQVHCLMHGTNEFKKGEEKIIKAMKHFAEMEI